MHVTRRRFLSNCLALGCSAANVAASPLPAEVTGRLVEPFPWRRFGNRLRSRFRDPRRHFVFEYYPWYASAPFRHWTQWDRVPPTDLATNTMPWLGAYDSRSRSVVERHASWIAESGVGVINVSWWGQGSFSDRAVPLIMDVMAEAEQKRPRIRRLGDQIGAWFAPAALLFAILVGYLSDDSSRFLAVLVVATPCPLLIAIPITVMSAISIAARRGIVVPGLLYYGARGP